MVAYHTAYNLNLWSGALPKSVARATRSRSIRGSTQQTFCAFARDLFGKLNGRNSSRFKNQNLSSCGMDEYLYGLRVAESIRAERSWSIKSNLRQSLRNHWVRP